MVLLTLPKSKQILALMFSHYMYNFEKMAKRTLKILGCDEHRKIDKASLIIF